ncbi:hypothetical protein PACTADRAFT_30262, partial [Pachysolen tannophilus NRRL Y-2460]
YTTIFNTLCKRNSVYVAAILGTTFAFQAAFDSGVTAWYNAHNKGKLWADVKQTI